MSGETTGAPPAADPAAAQARNEALRAEVQRISTTSGRSIPDLARESGIPYGTFTAWLSGTYKGRNDAQDDKVALWLRSREAAERMRFELPTGPGFVQTPSATAFMDVFEHAQHAPALTLVTGDAGVGKTQAIEAYRQRSTNVWVLVGQPCLSSPRMALDGIADLLGIDDGRGGGYAVSRAIVAKIRNTRGLLVIDEAQHLTGTTLDQLRTIHDLSKVGMALVGNEGVANRIGSATRRAEFAQIYSRVGMIVRRPRALMGDIEALLDAWSVSDQKARQHLATIGRKPGALRQMIMILRMALMQASAAGEALSARYVDMAWLQLSAQKLDVVS